MEKFDKVGLGQAVDRKAAFSAESDETGHAENAQLLGDEGLGEAELRRQLAHIRLGFAEMGDNHEPVRMGESLYDFGDFRRQRQILSEIAHVCRDSFRICRYLSIVISLYDDIPIRLLCQ